MFLLCRVDQAKGQTQEAARLQAAPSETPAEYFTTLREEISEKDLEREEALETETRDAPEATVEAPHLAEDAESRIKEVSNEPPPKEQPKNAFDVMKKATAVKPTGMDGHRYPKTGHFFGLHAL
jgi:hypothetical protein